MITIRHLCCFVILACFFACNGKEKANIIDENFQFADKQFQLAIVESAKAIENESPESIKRRERRKQGPLVSPRTIVDGKLEMVASGDWTSGFFPGSLWYMYEYTQDEKWKAEAIKFTNQLEDQKTNGITHDMGFKVYNSFGNGYRLTNDENYKNIIIESAYTLTTRYRESVKAIRSWDHNQDKWEYPVIIDNMLNLELLFWAFKQTNDSLFYNVAVNHANTTIANHFREDYSTYHVIGYDSITGKTLQKHTHQGYSHESAWARGQAWALYGYTMCYRETGIASYLEQAKKVYNYIFTHPNLPSDLIPYWDFNAPNIPNEERDVSAATVIASALYELSLYDNENSLQYLDKANLMIENLTQNYRATAGGDYGFLLLHSTGSKPGNFEVDAPLSYADYYFLEALLRKYKLENNKPLF